jgi:hypothetical protein
MRNSAKCDSQLEDDFALPHVRSPLNRNAPAMDDTGSFFKKRAALLESNLLVTAYGQEGSRTINGKGIWGVLLHHDDNLLACHHGAFKTLSKSALVDFSVGMLETTPFKPRSLQC